MRSTNTAKCRIANEGIEKTVVCLACQGLHCSYTLEIRYLLFVSQALKLSRSFTVVFSRNFIAWLQSREVERIFEDDNTKSTVALVLIYLSINKKM